MEYVEIGDLEQAEIRLAKAKNIVRKLSENDPRLLIVKLEEARLLALQNQHNKAGLLTEEVISLANPGKKIYKNIYSRALLNLAEYRWCNGEHEIADQLFQKAIEWRENHYGKNSHDVIIAHNLYSKLLPKGQTD